MTPVRAKRNSKVPNRFSSDNSRIETSNANGETIIDYNDNSTSTTHTLAPISKIKFKPVIREPLKVKLPKLKRPIQHQTKEKDVPLETSEIKIHKIKLPSLTKKSKSSSASKHDLPDLCKGSSKSASPQPKLQRTNKSNDQQSSRSGSVDIASPSFVGSSRLSSPHSDTMTKLPATPAKIDTSTISTVSSEEKAISHNNSFSSLEADGDSSGMEIVVSPPDDQPSGSGIRCPCGVEDDLGVMVECENCSTWQHGHCINIGSEDDAYEGYICAFCTLPKGQVYESLRQLTVNDRYQSRFQVLESLVKQKSHNTESHGLTKPKFTESELSSALIELRRVLGSLKVKVRLLTSELYETELRIWQNSNWSEDSKSDAHLYFVDRCKNNLRMNVHNMIRKMKTRSRLIEFALSQNEKENKDESSSEIDKLREVNMDILERVRELESQFHNYVSTTRSSNACDLKAQSE